MTWSPKTPIWWCPTCLACHLYLVRLDKFIVSIALLIFFIRICECDSRVCVCVCVSERETERERLGVHLFCVSWWCRWKIISLVLLVFCRPLLRCSSQYAGCSQHGTCCCKTKFSRRGTCWLRRIDDVVCVRKRHVYDLCKWFQCNECWIYFISGNT